jgi:hypothetical protein
MKKVKKIALAGAIPTIPPWSDQSGLGQTPAQIRDLEVVFASTVNIILAISGFALLIMIVIGGFQYLNAGDNPKEAEKASKTLTYALIGLVVIVASWFILQAVERITGLNLTTFRIR